MGRSLHKGVVANLDLQAVIRAVFLEDERLQGSGAMMKKSTFVGPCDELAVATEPLYRSLPKC